MRKKIHILVFALFLTVYSSHAQEIRWSNYYAAMPTINAASTGAFAGDYRLIGGYRMSQYCRKQIEKIFGWAKQYGGLRRMQFRGLDRVGSHVTFIMTAYNLLRMRNIELQGAI